MFRRRLLTVWAVILCLGVLVGAGYGQTLKEAVNASEPEVRTFSLTGNETVTESLGALGGTQLNIIGNGFDIIATPDEETKISGISLENQTLNIEGVRNISGFNEASYTAGGIITSSASAVNIGNDTTLDFKYGNAIRNTYNSQLTIGENVSFTSDGTSNGNTYGFIYNDATSTATIKANTKFVKGNAYGFGAGVYNAGEMSLNKVVFSSNTAGYGGAGIKNSGNMTINGGIFEYNTVSSSFGGAISNGGTIQLTDDILFYNNKAICGGAISNSGDILIGNNAKFLSNKVSAPYGSTYNTITKGGALENTGYIKTGNNVLFEDNTAKNGGSIYNEKNNADKGIIEIGKNANFNANMARDSYLYRDYHERIAYGGAIYNKKGTITLTDGAKFTSNIAATKGGAIYNEGGTINLIADTSDIEFTGNKTLSVYSDGTRSSEINEISNAIHDNGGYINLFASDNASIIFNDRITSEDDNSLISINMPPGRYPATGKIILNEDMTGYIGNVTVYGGTLQIGQNGTLFGGNMTVNNAVIDTANNIIQEHNFNGLKINDKLNIVADADLQNKTMDKFSAESFDGAGKINLKAVNILTDIDNSEESVETEFVTSDNLKDKVSSVNSAASKLYKYNVNYNSNSGNIIFTKAGGNSSIMAGAVAGSVGGALTQANVLTQAFTTMDVQSVQIKQAKAKPVLYASASDRIFENSNLYNGFWIRPYMVNETIKLSNNDVDNKVFGTLAGIDTAVNDNSMISLYLGYAGSEQKYDNTKINQNGYLLGVSYMWMKEKYYLGLTGNFCFSNSTSENDFGKDEFGMNMYSVGARTGYNLNLSQNWTLEPNVTLIYGLINNRDYETSKGTKIDGQKTNNIIVNPQIKAKWYLGNGWQPYGLLGYSENIGEKGKVVADGVEFEADKIDGYVEYGIGCNKDFVDSAWSCYLQIAGRSGGSNGFTGNLGVKYSF